MPCSVARCWRTDASAFLASQRTKALGLDENLPFLALFLSHLAAEVIVGAQKPFSVPAVLADRFFHPGDLSEIAVRQFGCTRARRLQFFLAIRTRTAAGDFRQLATGKAEQPCDEDRLGNLAFFVGGGLKGLTGGIGKAVEIQAVVPIGASDKGQPMRAQPGEGVLETALQVLIQRLFRTWLVII